MEELLPVQQLKGMPGQKASRAEQLRTGDVHLDLHRRTQPRPPNSTERPFRRKQVVDKVTRFQGTHRGGRQRGSDRVYSV
ncbi:hypothetical protein SAY86_013160 [Trapa natans]|uniref:Uncharacterized protein n=1 Tax=Trapa natans TaxID=22666 RepID=A0AAN7RCA9_TRANT|nr:hypothetical protein SAY86_013160 [Trapa natans]